MAAGQHVEVDSHRMEVADSHKMEVLDSHRMEEVDSHRMGVPHQAEEPLDSSQVGQQQGQVPQPWTWGMVREEEEIGKEPQDCSARRWLEHYNSWAYWQPMQHPLELDHPNPIGQQQNLQVQEQGAVWYTHFDHLRISTEDGLGSLGLKLRWLCEGLLLLAREMRVFLV
jgi:hypothetical protein